MLMAEHTHFSAIVKGQNSVHPGGRILPIAFLFGLWNTSTRRRGLFEPLLNQYPDIIGAK
jgi:hypothetical protein